jgi:hypothetical protein
LMLGAFPSLSARFPVRLKRNAPYLHSFDSILVLLQEMGRRAPFFVE